MMLATVSPFGVAVTGTFSFGMGGIEPGTFDWFCDNGDGGCCGIGLIESPVAISSWEGDGSFWDVITWPTSFGEFSVMRLTHNAFSFRTHAKCFTFFISPAFQARLQFTTISLNSSNPTVNLTASPMTNGRPGAAECPADNIPHYQSWTFTNQIFH